MSLKEDLLARAREKRRRIVFPEGDDPRIVQAAYQLQEKGICEPVLITGKTQLETVAKDHGLGAPKFEIIDPAANHEAFTQRLMALRAHKGMTREEAGVLCENPLYKAAIMVRDRQADGCVGGAVNTTAQTVRAAIVCIGTLGTVSSFFLMTRTDRNLLYADCGVIPNPTAAQLAQIAADSAANWRLLTGSRPLLAMLSFSTKGSAKGASIDAVLQATALAKAANPDLQIDGELQADAALVPAVARKKAPGSPTAGQANVLVFPNLHAGNIAYKLTERLAGFTALGPILQGLARPMNDLSRGCSVEDVVLIGAITAIQCGVSL